MACSTMHLSHREVPEVRVSIIGGDVVEDGEV